MRVYVINKNGNPLMPCKVDKRDKSFALPDGYTLYKKGDVISIDGYLTEIASINGKGSGFYYWIYQENGKRKYASVSHKKVKLIEFAKTINYMSDNVAKSVGFAFTFSSPTDCPNQLGTSATKS